ASDADIEQAIRRAVWAKWAGHLINLPGFVKPSRTMHAIGG
ncbi:MAG TPA: GTP 3',8-cyclase MoaA, partial [Bacillota bacterium]